MNLQSTHSAALDALLATVHASGSVASLAERAHRQLSSDGAIPDSVLQHFDSAPGLALPMKRAASWGLHSRPPTDIPMGGMYSQLGVSSSAVPESLGLSSTSSHLPLGHHPDHAPVRMAFGSALLERHSMDMSLIGRQVNRDLKHVS